MKNSTQFAIGGQNLYVKLQSVAGEVTNYQVGTMHSPESPVSLSLKGKDSPNLRFIAATSGLEQISLVGTGHY